MLKPNQLRDALFKALPDLQAQPEKLTMHRCHLNTAINLS